MPPRKSVAPPQNEAESAVKQATLRALARHAQIDDLERLAKSVIDLLDSPKARRVRIERMMKSAYAEFHQIPDRTLGIARTADMTEDGLPIFATREEMPQDYIDAPTATKKYGLSHSTIMMWIKRGKIVSRGRLRGSARGGGYHVLRESEIRSCLNNPRPAGRPRQIG